MSSLAQIPHGTLLNTVALISSHAEAEGDEEAIGWWHDARFSLAGVRKFRKRKVPKRLLAIPELDLAGARHLKHAGRAAQPQSELACGVLRMQGRHHRDHR
jgi:hypothetical protein